MRSALRSGRWSALLCGWLAFVAIISTVSTLTMVLSGPVATAQEPESADATPLTVSQLEYFMTALGPLYIVLFGITSFFFVAVTVMNFMAVRHEAMVPQLLVAGFEANLNEKKYQEAYEMAKADRSFLGKVLAAGMSKLSAGYGESQTAMQEVGEAENMQAEHRLSYIALVGSIAPMLGLLGTVDGMVVSFKKIAASDTPPKPSVLAEGVSTALVTTLVGLWLAIPAIMIYAFLKNRLQALASEVGGTAGGLMSRFANVPQKK